MEPVALNSLFQWLIGMNVGLIIFGFSYVRQGYKALKEDSYATQEPGSLLPQIKKEKKI